ncbi:MAG: hypothetical protein GC136_10740 [Alphaproteobacteria bacterium]|nr:hypothetical protein [Alphaproteobacteria bacterium]
MAAINTYFITCAQGGDLRPLVRPIHDQFRDAGVEYHLEKPNCIEVHSCIAEADLVNFVMPNASQYNDLQVRCK